MDELLDTDAVLVEPGAILFIAVHSTQGENPPKIVVASFFDTAFTYAKSNGGTILLSVNISFPSTILIELASQVWRFW